MEYVYSGATLDELCAVKCLVWEKKSLVRRSEVPDKSSRKSGFHVFSTLLQKTRTLSPSERTLHFPHEGDGRTECA